MAEKMTWEEIQKKYPSQWVSLANVEKDERGVLKSGIVVATGPDLKTVTRKLKRQKITSDLFEYTGPVKNFLGFAKWDIGNVESD